MRRFSRREPNPDRYQGTWIEPILFRDHDRVSFPLFLESKVDVVLLETGLGGRLDATNIVTPSVSVLTSIDLDHQLILGNSLAEIARERRELSSQGFRLFRYLKLRRYAKFLSLLPRPRYPGPIC